MYKCALTYEDFDGNSITEDFYFNLTKAEIIELEAEWEGGLQGTLDRLTKANDVKALVEMFKGLIAKTYGQRSEDGKRFRKTPDILGDFMDTNAYSEMFIKLATDSDFAAEFVNGIMPRDLMAEAKKQGLLDADGKVPVTALPTSN